MLYIDINKFPIILRRGTRLLKGRKALLEIVQALPQMLVHILRHLHLRLQFLKVFNVDVVPPLTIRLLLLNLHLLLLLQITITIVAHVMVLGFIICCLLGVVVVLQRAFLLLLLRRPARSVPSSCALLYALRPAVRQTHFLTASLKLLLILFAVVIWSWWTHSLLRGCSSGKIGVRRAMMLRHLCHLNTTQILIDFAAIIMGGRGAGFCRNGRIIIAAFFQEVIALMANWLFGLDCIIIIEAQMTVPAHFRRHCVAIAYATSAATGTIHLRVLLIRPRRRLGL